jgi:hypothetical protein
MPYRLLADAVLVVHLAFIVFVVFGGLLVLRWPRIAWLHLPAVAWGAWIEFTGRICPLTPLEIGLRERGGEAGFTDGFIEHYITALIYPDGLDRRQQILLGVFVLVLNAGVYAYVVARHRAKAG